MTVYKLPLILEPQPEGGYVVTCPLLPELITEGEDIDGGIRNANEALGVLIEGLKALGRPLPPALRTC
jgi:antitoxin HicB